jgi:hypothetical protein
MRNETGDTFLIFLCYAFVDGAYTAYVGRAAENSGSGRRERGAAGIDKPGA